MAINKVIRKGVVALDLTSDTVTPETLMSGTTAHNAAGETIVGTASSGIDTTDATATAADMLNGKTAYAKGEKITGTFTIDNELITQDNLISQIQTALQNKAAGGSGGTTLYDEWINLYSLPTTFAVEPPDTGDVTTVYYEIPEGCTALLFAVGAVKDELAEAGIVYMYNTVQKYWTNVTLGTNSLTCSIPDGDSIATITFNYPAAYMLPINLSLLP